MSILFNVNILYQDRPKVTHSEYTLEEKDFYFIGPIVQAQRCHVPSHNSVAYIIYFANSGVCHLQTL